MCSKSHVQFEQKTACPNSEKRPDVSVNWATVCTIIYEGRNESFLLRYSRFSEGNFHKRSNIIICMLRLQYAMQYKMSNKNVKFRKNQMNHNLCRFGKTNMLCSTLYKIRIEAFLIDAHKSKEPNESIFLQFSKFSDKYFQTCSKFNHHFN